MINQCCKLTDIDFIGCDGIGTPIIFISDYVIIGGVCMAIDSDYISPRYTSPSLCSYCGTPKDPMMLDCPECARAY